jgi:hypothetical protein
MINYYLTYLTITIALDSFLFLYYQGGSCGGLFFIAAALTNGDEKVIVSK